MWMVDSLLPDFFGFWYDLFLLCDNAHDDDDGEINEVAGILPKPLCSVKRVPARRGGSGVTMAVVHSWSECSWLVQVFTSKRGG